MQEYIRNKILKSIHELELNLKGKTVLTEAATGAYVVTSVIAAAAGARVFALTRNTRYGTTEEVRQQTAALAALFDGNLDITIIEDLTPELLKEADIITNSGHLRPLDKDKLQYVKPGAVISYMYEAWEYRKDDLDLEYCKEKNILVAATNERHPDIDVFNYLGELAVRLIHDAGKCLYKNKFIILSNNDFGYHIAKTLVRLCNKVGVIDLPQNKMKYPKEIDWLGDFPLMQIPEDYSDAEAIIFTAYPFENTWIGESGPITAGAFTSLSQPLLLRYAGHVDTDHLNEHHISFYPEQVKCGHMGILLSELGFDPIIRLQAGGLKVAEIASQQETHFKAVAILDYIR